ILGAPQKGNDVCTPATISNQTTEVVTNFTSGPKPVVQVNATCFKTAVPILCLAALCSHCAADDFENIAVVADQEINDSSGLAISYENPDAIWVHNDSGDEARLFLVGLDGVTQPVVDIPHIKAHDWEDVCSFQIDGESWLLIADVGDNSAKRGKGIPSFPACQLYLLKEPVIPKSNGVTTTSVGVWSTITFYYFEDGRPSRQYRPINCESVAVDVKERKILLLTKTVPGKLYQLPLDTKAPRQKRWADKVAEIRMPPSEMPAFIEHAIKRRGVDVIAPTAMDISSDGRTMAICSTANGLVVHRTFDQTWADAITRSRTAFQLPHSFLKTSFLPTSLVPPKQWEAICFDRTGKSIYLNCEGSGQPLWRANIPNVKAIAARNLEQKGIEVSFKDE
ncbi:MAG: hypothetical protein ABGZ53_36765, partial [Fuerstiella sp.]